MGHDIHFLSRLNRLALPQVELAMSLYNDTPMLRFILKSLELPEGVERIALSIGEKDTGPFLVVHRDGHFVTCLGEGMAPVGLQIVPRSHLNALAQRVEVLRDRLEMARKLKGPDSRIVDLFRPLMVAGHRLAREDFIGAAAWAPMLPAQIFSLIRELHEDLRFLTNQLRSAQKIRAAKPDTLRAYWDGAWAIGHLTLLLGMEGRAMWELAVSDIDAAEDPATISWPAVRLGMCAMALRGAWAAGKIGKLALPSFKAQYHGGGSDLAFYNAALGLFSLAVRHKGLRGEIRKALQHEVPLAERGPCGVLFQVGPEHLPPLFEEMLRLVDEAPEALLGFARRIYFERVQLRIREGSPFRFASAEEVPSELALPAYASMPFLLVGDVSALTSLFCITALCARQDAEALYFPREFHKDYNLPFHPLFVAELLREMHKLYGPRQPERAAEKPGRNDPCPCGSGTKHKKCCGLNQDVGL